MTVGQKDKYPHAEHTWHLDIGAFGKLLQEAAKEGPWWGEDSDLKYLEIYVDTRTGGFILKSRHGVRISPDRVKAAIEKGKARMTHMKGL